MLIIKVFIQTDFPDPVAPAINICGILSIEETIISPEIVFPSAIGILDVQFWYSFEDNISFKDTFSFKVFATSIPITDFPGIGASILISEDAKAKDKSSAKFTRL